MGKVKLYVTEYEFEQFMRYQAFEGRTSRQFETDIEVIVPQRAIKEVKKIYRGYLTVYVHEHSNW